MFKQVLFFLFSCFIASHAASQSKSTLRHLDSAKNIRLTLISEQLYALVNTDKSDSARKVALLQLQELGSKDSARIYQLSASLMGLRKDDSLKKERQGK
jgi:hypothetical protein